MSFHVISSREKFLNGGDDPILVSKFSNRASFFSKIKSFNFLNLHDSHCISFLAIWHIDLPLILVSGFFTRDSDGIVPTCFWKASVVYCIV